jgi:hypothetical protein
VFSVVIETLFPVVLHSTTRQRLYTDAEHEASHVSVCVHRNGECSNVTLSTELQLPSEHRVTRAFVFMAEGAVLISV